MSNAVGAALASTGSAIAGVVIAPTTDKVPVGRVVEGLSLLDTANRWLNSQPTLSSASDREQHQSSAQSSPRVPETMGEQLANGWNRFVKAAEPYISVKRVVEAFPGYHHRSGDDWSREKRVVVTDCGLITPYNPPADAAVAPATAQQQQQQQQQQQSNNSNNNGNAAAAVNDFVYSEVVNPANAHLPDPYRECRAVLARVPEFERKDREHMAAYDKVVEELIREEYTHSVNGTDTWVLKRQREVRLQKAKEAKNLSIQSYQ